MANNAVPKKELVRERYEKARKKVEEEKDPEKKEERKKKLEEETKKTNKADNDLLVGLPDATSNDTQIEDDGESFESESLESKTDNNVSRTAKTETERDDLTEIRG